MPGLSVRQAAQRAQTTDRTIRRWIAEGKLVATRTARGWTVAESDLAACLDARADVSPSAAVQRPSETSDDWRQYVADLRAQLEVKDQQISELHTLLAQAQRALPTPQERPPAGPTANAPSETPQQSVARARAWWRFW